MEPDREKQLIESAIQARGNAYAPYSEFAVGAALLTSSGEIFTGCNVENASYGLAICAERGAICSAVSAGQREYQAIVIAATPLASPCGACRQFIVEFGKDINVIAVDPDNPARIKRWKSGELIPDSFEFDH